MSILTLTLDERIDGVFGDATDPMPLLDARAAEVLPEFRPIVWECDAATFRFSHVSASAEAVLGYPAARWTEEPTFWADVVLHAEDRDESVSYCVAETACDRDHAFEYRARAQDGSLVRLRDVVRIVPATGDQPRRLRGLMLVVG